MPPASEAEKVVEGSFFFDPEDRLYRDHFPGNPVVPGSVIVRAFLLAAGRFCPHGETCSVEGFKFRKFVSPGEYAYRMEIGGNTFKCFLLDGTSVAASGTLVL